MTCFWTDLVGATQAGCGAGGLVPVVAGVALMEDAPAPLEDSVNAVNALGIVDGYELFLRVVSDNGVAPELARSPVMANLVSTVCFYLDNGNCEPNQFFTCGFAPATDKFWVFANGGLDAIEERVAFGSLTVTEAATVFDTGCNGTQLVSLERCATLGGTYAVDIVGPGVMEVTRLANLPAPTGCAMTVGSIPETPAIVHDMLRIQGTVEGEFGTTATLDFWLVGAYNGCF